MSTIATVDKKPEAPETLLGENAIKVLEKRYLKRDENGKILERPSHLFQRVAEAIAKAELSFGDDKAASHAEFEYWRTVFLKMMTNLEFLPNSPTLMNAGRKLGQLSACFVLPVEDSMEDIFDAVKATAMIHKSGGGTGFSFSRLRPSGDVVGSTKGVSSGPISFMTVFDTATEAVKQGGTRRGANMGMLRIDHPDIMKFISCKDDSKKFNNFNISVGITEEFMKAVEKGEEYELLNPRTKKVAGTLKARDVFEKIVKQAWKNGEPGIVFLDRVNAANQTPEVGEIESTNPCGEQPLLPYESCNLGSINLGKMLKRVDGSLAVDYDKLCATVHSAVRFLDNVIEVNKYPLKEIDKMTRANRKIGLGVMGLADMLAQLGAPYNSEDGIALAEKVMSFVQTEGRNASKALAATRGVFPNWEKSIWFKQGVRVRNATVTTIAPTGTLSMLAAASSGIEPFFAVSYVKNVMDGVKLIETNPYFLAELQARGIYSQELIEKISASGSLHDIDEIPEELKRVYVTAHDITPLDHIKMQAAIQKYIDNAVSKTVNFPNEATEADVKEVYLLAYKLNCKGVTVYRDGSRDEQVLTVGPAKPAELAQADAAARPAISKQKRPAVVCGGTRKMATGCGGLYITVNDMNGKPFEVFTNMGKAGGCAASQAEAIGRLVSLALRSGIDAEDVTRELTGISCHQPAWGEGGRILSCADAIGKAMQRHVSEAVHVAPVSGGNGKKPYVDSRVYAIGACPECGGAVEHEGGCAVCHSCAFTRCG